MTREETPDARYAREVAEWRGKGSPLDQIPVLRLDPDQPAPDLDPEQHFSNEHELPPHAHMDEH